MELSSHLWRTAGSFCPPDGEAEQTANGYRYAGDGYVVETTYETDANGVCLQKSVLKNTSDKPLQVGCLHSRFLMPDGEYEVYTQSNVHYSESDGMWQKLHTGVLVRCAYMRTALGVAPMLAMWNNHTHRGTAFHLLAESAWEISAENTEPQSTKHRIYAEMGLDSRQTNLTLAPGEELRFPEILRYEFSNKLDLDCWKLHAWLNRNMPRRALPIIYNSWLYRFDTPTADGLLAQIDRAKALGTDYFVLDASWYGVRAKWSTTRGDWEEQPDGVLDGRMAEISEAVRKAGMGFGFWLEAETADEGTKIVREHPEYFFKYKKVNVAGEYKYFLNFADDAARKYITDTTCALIDKYHATFIKFDFNMDAAYDASGTAFTAFHKGFCTYLETIRSRYPGIYLEGCASGGMRMAMQELRNFDSFWLSDNQSPYHGLRIVKDTMLRFMPQAIERWIVAQSSQEYRDCNGNYDRLFAANDGLWKDIRSVRPSFYEAFITGGVIGYSCDLTKLSEPDFEFFRQLSENWKKDAAFWKTAVGRILCDTDQLTALQYSDEALCEVRVLAASLWIRTTGAIVIPVLDANARYRLDAPEQEQDGEIRTGAEWMQCGLTMNKFIRYTMRAFTLRKV